MFQLTDETQICKDKPKSGFENQKQLKVGDWGTIIAFKRKNTTQVNPVYSLYCLL